VNPPEDTSAFQAIIEDQAATTVHGTKADPMAALVVLRAELFLMSHRAEESVEPEVKEVYL
jgi:hypothetical protein